jgi:hypothetical protein
MTGGEFLFGVVALIAGAIITVIVSLVRILLRLGDRGARRVAGALSRPAQTLFGPTGPPEELCRRLVQKHPALGPGVQGGLSFSGSGCRGRLDFISDRTEIRFELDDRGQPGLEVSTASFISQIAEEDPEAFRVRGSGELYRRIFANGELPRMLRDWGVPFEWALGPDRFELRIHGQPGDEEELWRWLKGAFRLLQAIPGFEDDAPIQIPTVSRFSPAEGECQVCGVSLGEGTVVRCRRCATPHHEDCWAYTGWCSTFACSERNWIR